ncbi:hypothetical protein ABOM_007675 [Aspergillus bombycis]|uniref:Fe2OG dioxygenase domain-containing protein n=1 Tax=Aspergillus bombycis TaxID=109264 RepID=A0A1F7ZVC7_9EURO|nr:hypothetical protein ABOM_007675 [Aspergillus bombycis]OGM43416.1 hypothetical protein ABOM_007675 [Aspergillus bombycis]
MIATKEPPQKQLSYIETEDIFDPETHLNYTPPASLLTMEDLGLNGPKTSTSIAGSAPFPFLSETGVRAYRRCLMRPHILKACAKSYGAGTFILRNLAQHSKFISDLWTHPETMRIVSEVAGVPLTIIMPTEIGHTNIQTSGCTVDDLTRELEVEPRASRACVDKEDGYDPLRESAVIPWHYDSYPYVAVLMLSDTTHMTGGETYIKKGDGSAVKVEGPALGHCVILQGGQVEHLAARAFGATERITTITSYRAAIPGLYDDSYLSNVRPYCDLSELYTEWTNYRLEKVKQEIEHMQATIIQRVGRGRDSFPFDEVYHFAEQQISYLKRTVRQTVDQTLCVDVRRRFDVREINSVGEKWAHVRAHQRFRDLLPGVMAQTLMWGPVRPYLSDWEETKYMIRSGNASLVHSQQGMFLWDPNRVEEYLFGDELLRQGLKEVLLAWLYRFDLVTLGS